LELYDVNELWKFDLRVGLVKGAERLKRTRKLIKLEVDFGNEQRTIITGLADQYAPEDLEGKKFVFVLNLKPKKLSGVECQGMLIVAESEGVRSTFCQFQMKCPSEQRCGRCRLEFLLPGSLISTSFVHAGKGIKANVEVNMKTSI